MREPSTTGSARSRSRQARATGSWRTVVAPPGEHRPLHAVGNQVIEALLTGARDALADARATGPDRVPDGRPELGRPGGRPDQPPVPGPLRPAPDPASHRRGARRRSALRHPRGGVPVLPAGPRRGPSTRAARLGGHRQRRVRPVRLPLAVRGLGRPAPPRGGLQPHRRDRTSRPPPRRCARSCPGWRRASTARRTTSSSTRRRCASRSMRPTTGTGRSTHACARSPVSSWEPDCRSIPSLPRMRWRNSSAGPTRREVRRVERQLVGSRPASHGGVARRLWPSERAMPNSRVP